MPRWSLSFAAAALATALVPGQLAAAEPPPPPAPPDAPAPSGKHCLDGGHAKLLLNHTLGGALNPLGFEHQLALALCLPLIRQPGILFDLTNVEVGLSNYLSPTYVHQGGFVTVTPLSILQLKAEVNGVYVWTLPTDGAGYFVYSSYDDDFSDELRTPERAQRAGGFVVSGSATLRGRVGVPGELSVLAANSFLAEYWSLGDGPFYYNLRRDILLEAKDGLLKNTGAVLLEIPISENVATRVGVTDDLLVAPGSGRTSNILGGLATLLIRRVGGAIRDLQPLVRVGVYTHHASANGFRTGEVYVLGGVTATYELAVFD